MSSEISSSNVAQSVAQSKWGTGPKLSLIRGVSKTVFLHIAQGPVVYSEIVQALGSSAKPGSIHTALYRLRTYGLIELGPNSLYSITELGQGYRAIFQSTQQVREGENILPPPAPDLQEDNRPELESEREISPEVGPRATFRPHLSYSKATFRPHLSYSLPDISSQTPCSIEQTEPADNPSITTPRIGDGGRGRRFSPLSSREKDLAVNALTTWRKDVAPSLSESSIVGNLLFNAVLGRVPRNGLSFKSIGEAAQYFEKEESEFLAAINQLKQRRVAYLYTVNPNEHKVAIYLEFLDKLREGRWL